MGLGVGDVSVPAATFPTRARSDDIPAEAEVIAALDPALAAEDIDSIVIGVAAAPPCSANHAPKFVLVLAMAPC